MLKRVQLLSKFSVKNDFKKTRPFFKWVIWATFFSYLCNSPFAGTYWRVALLKIFGAKIGKNVRLNPFLKIKFPWKFSLGNHSWIGNSVKIDNVSEVEIGHDVCISQGTYFCGGNHNYKSTNFEYLESRIIVGPHSWLAAKSIVAPGAVIGEGVVLTIGSIAIGKLSPYKIYQGNPAIAVRKRVDNS